VKKIYLQISANHEHIQKNFTNVTVFGCIIEQLMDISLHSTRDCFFFRSERDRIVRWAALMFRFDFLDQPANRGNPLSAGDRTGGINIEMNWFPSHYLSCCGKAGPYLPQQRGFVYSVGSSRRPGYAHSRGLSQRQNFSACRCVRTERSVRGRNV